MFGLFAKKNRKSLTEAAQEARNQPGVCLVDVRSPGEFRLGHLPGAINLPMDNLGAADKLIMDKNSQLYVYCASGARSAMAVGMLKRLGYTQCENVGGIGAYAGELER